MIALNNVLVDGILASMPIEIDEQRHSVQFYIEIGTTEATKVTNGSMTKTAVVPVYVYRKKLRKKVMTLWKMREQYCRVAGKLGMVDVNMSCCVIAEKLDAIPVPVPQEAIKMTEKELIQLCKYPTEEAKKELRRLAGTKEL